MLYMYLLPFSVTSECASAGGSRPIIQIRDKATEILNLHDIYMHMYMQEHVEPVKEARKNVTPHTAYRNIDGGQYPKNI